MASVAAGQSWRLGANWRTGTTRLDLLNSPSASVADSDGRLAFRRPVCRRFAPVSAPRADNALWRIRSNKWAPTTIFVRAPLACRTKFHDSDVSGWQAGGCTSWILTLVCHGKLAAIVSRKDESRPISWTFPTASESPVLDGSDETLCRSELRT